MPSASANTEKTPQTFPQAIIQIQWLLCGKTVNFNPSVALYNMSQLGTVWRSVNATRLSYSTLTEVLVMSDLCGGDDGNSSDDLRLVGDLLHGAQDLHASLCRVLPALISRLRHLKTTPQA